MAGRRNTSNMCQFRMGMCIVGACTTVSMVDFYNTRRTPIAGRCNINNTYWIWAGIGTRVACILVGIARSGAVITVVAILNVSVTGIGGLRTIYQTGSKNTRGRPRISMGIDIQAT